MFGYSAYVQNAAIAVATARLAPDIRCRGAQAFSILLDDTLLDNIFECMG